jgi:acyl-CoA dehydrogenase-like protein
MVQLTRLDCAIASAGLMRMALVQAIHHARHRVVFGKPLAEQPLMQVVLADMAVEIEGAVALVMRLCRAFDLAAGDAGEAARARLLTPAVKYLVCKIAPSLIYEAMECLGGNGYVEESILPWNAWRLWRRPQPCAPARPPGRRNCSPVPGSLRRAAPPTGWPICPWPMPPRFWSGRCRDESYDPISPASRSSAPCRI